MDWASPPAELVAVLAAEVAREAPRLVLAFAAAEWHLVEVPAALAAAAGVAAQLPEWVAVVAVWQSAEVPVESAAVAVAVEW